MAKVRVEVRNHPLARCVGSESPTPFGLPFFRPSDAARVIARLPWYRLLVKVVVLPADADPLTRPVEIPETHSPPAILDTGAPLTCFPATLWRQFAAEIRWLDQPPREDGEPWRMTILGGSWTYRLGRVRLGATDINGRWLDAATTVAMFLDEPPAGASRPPRHAILGLRTPLLDRRRVRHAGTTPDDLPVWWLEDDIP